jgi:hypothetical protein
MRRQACYPNGGRPGRDQQDQQFKNRSRKQQQPNKRPSETLRLKGNLTQKVTSKKYSLTFTHINCHLRDQLIEFLEDLLGQIPRLFEVYTNTVEVFVNSEAERAMLIEEVMNWEDELDQFGFKQNLKWGINTGMINIFNFNRTQGKQLMDYLKALLPKEQREIEAMKWGSQDYIVIGFTSKSSAC